MKIIPKNSNSTKTFLLQLISPLMVKPPNQQQLRRTKSHDGQQLISPTESSLGDICLPTHIRCSSHTLNLVTTTDADRYMASLPKNSLFKTTYRRTMEKATALWNKISRSRVAADECDQILGTSSFLSISGVLHY